MSNYSAGRGPRPGDPNPGLRLAALAAVVLGVVLLAAAAFVLSYSGIHEIALRAGVAPELARLYPLIFDAMLVIAGAAALSLRGAEWWARGYAWFSLLLLLAAVAIGDAVHATGVALPAQPTRAAVAVTPWVLLLLAFGLWLAMLRHFRRTRSASAQRGQAAGQAATTGDAAGQAANGTGAGNGDREAGQRAAVTWASAGGAGEGRSLPPPRTGLDTLLGPKEGHPGAMATAGPDAAAATEEYPGQAGYHDAGHYPDPVSYGEETGYVHPESYRDHGDYPGPDYPGHGDYPRHGGYPEQASPAEAPDEAGSGEQVAPGPGPGPSWPDSPARTTPAGEHPTEAHPAEPQPGKAHSGDAHSDEAQPGEAQPGEAQPGDAHSGDAGSPPAMETRPETTAQPSAAEHQDAPAAVGDAPKTPAPAATPWLERMRSTPAPPEDLSAQDPTRS